MRRTGLRRCCLCRLPRQAPVDGRCQLGIEAVEKSLWPPTGSEMLGGGGLAHDGIGPAGSSGILGTLPSSARAPSSPCDPVPLHEPSKSRQQSAETDNHNRRSATTEGHVHFTAEMGKTFDATGRVVLTSWNRSRSSSVPMCISLKTARRSADDLPLLAVARLLLTMRVGSCGAGGTLIGLLGIENEVRVDKLPPSSRPDKLGSGAEGLGEAAGGRPSSSQLRLRGLLDPAHGYGKLLRQTSTGSKLQGQTTRDAWPVYRRASRPHRLGAPGHQEAQLQTLSVAKPVAAHVQDLRHERLPPLVEVWHQHDK